MAIIATITIATASKVQDQAPADMTDAMDAMNVEVATISQMADAAQTAGECSRRRKSNDSQVNAPKKA